MILIPTKSGTFAHCELVFVNKASTDGGEQQPSSLTGGQPNLQPSNPYLQKEASQPYRKPTHSAAKHPNPAAETTDAAEATIRHYGITN